MMTCSGRREALFAPELISLTVLSGEAQQIGPAVLAHLKLGKSPAIPDQAELPTLAPALSWVVPAEGMSPTFRVASPSNRRHAASKVRSDVQLDGNAVRWRPFPHAINLDVTGLANSSANKSLRPTWMSAPLSYWPVWAVSLDRNS